MSSESSDDSRERCHSLDQGIDPDRSTDDCPRKRKEEQDCCDWTAAQEPYDAPLTPIGMQQAADLGLRLQAGGAEHRAELS